MSGAKPDDRQKQQADRVDTTHGLFVLGHLFMNETTATWSFARGRRAYGPISTENQQEFLDGFDRGRASNGLYFVEIFAMEHEVLDEGVGILDDCQPICGELIVQNGKLKFPSPAQLHSYQQHYQRISALVSQEHEVQKRHQQDASQKLDRAAKLVDSND